VALLDAKEVPSSRIDVLKLDHESNKRGDLVRPIYSHNVVAQNLVGSFLIGGNLLARIADCMAGEETVKSALTK
jgi:hypothetical protein